jgi:hypothetical protein
MAETATLTLRADISELQRKLRSIPGEADGQAKQMAVSLERAFKRAEKASADAARNSAAAQAASTRETERAVIKLAELAAAKDPVEQLTLRFKRQADEIERLGKLTGNTEQAQKALAAASSDYADEVAKLTASPASAAIDDVADAADGATGSTYKLQQQTMSLRKNLGDAANSLMAGQSPFTVLAQQGPQILEIFGEAEDASELLKNSFGGLLTKAKSAGAGLAVAAVAVAALGTAYSVTANMADENADGNNRLAASFAKLTSEVSDSTQALLDQQVAMGKLKTATDDRRADLLVEIGAMDRHELAAEREKKAVAESTRETMLQVTAQRAALASKLQTAEATFRTAKTTSEEYEQAKVLTTQLREQIKVEDEKIASAKANYDANLDLIDSQKLARQELDRASDADKGATGSTKERTSAVRDAIKAEKDQAAALEKIRSISEAAAVAGASAERQLGMAASKQIKELNAIMVLYADQPDLIKEASAAEDAVRTQLVEDLAELQRTQEAEAQANRTAFLKRETDERMRTEQAIHDKRMTNARNFHDASIAFTSGVSDLMNVVAKETSKRDRELAMRQFKVAKAAGIAEATINGAVAITRALAGLGPILGPIAATGIAATTAAQVATIAAQKPAFDRGGMIQGGSRMADQVPINALPGEAVLSRQAVSAIGGREGVDRMNRGGAPGQNVVMVPVYKHFGRFVQDELQRSSVLQGAMMAGRQVGALGYSR